MLYLYVSLLPSGFLLYLCYERAYVLLECKAIMDKPKDHSRQLYGRRFGKKLRPCQSLRLERGTQRWGLSLETLEKCQDLSQLFPHNPQEIWLEIGFGGGEHTAWQAKQNPEVGIIAAEFFINGVASLCRHLEQSALDNVRFVHGDGRCILDRLPANAISRTFILHPDPWPKKRHHFRRIINPETLDLLANVMPRGAQLRCATDHSSYKIWMLQHLLAHPAWVWTAKRSQDWSQRSADWPQTRYEAKALNEGRTPLYLQFSRQ